jgi:ABC-type xylose transport system permease subunit
MKNIIKERWSAPTPKFWKKVQKVGIALGAIGGTLLTLPVALPVGIVTLAGYLTAVGATIATVSQITVEPQVNKEEINEQK